ncbi:hypothetical protein [Morganella morganii IS15]|nr:hypothetical protein CSB69_1378 [Morganella morganii]EMP50017.1 hypothetical protein C790_02689 [Morganella morganii SC01]ETO43056.1 hypothetical protein X965_18015 [Morganella sp. EGD-HP17]CDK68467.1 hypothetical protein [Morganella morganii IS15]
MKTESSDSNPDISIPGYRDFSFYFSDASAECRHNPPLTAGHAQAHTRKY